MTAVPALDVTIVTGMSGAGRSSAGDVLEDLGFFVIDNLPPALIPKITELARGGERPDRYGLVVDVRSGAFMEDLDAALAELRDTGARTRILFLDASDETLVRRFEASRRPHPLATADRVTDGIAQERALLEQLKGQADLVIDTSNLNVHELRDRLRERFGGAEGVSASLQANVVSFGYKHGVPLDVDIVFDCRFLPNPHWVERLRPSSRHRRERPSLRAPTARSQGVPRRGGADVRVAAPRVRPRGQGIPLYRHRVHGWPAPRRGDGGRDRQGARSARIPGPSPSPRPRT